MALAAGSEVTQKAYRLPFVSRNRSHTDLPRVPCLRLVAERFAAPRQPTGMKVPSPCSGMHRSMEKGSIAPPSGPRPSRRIEATWVLPPA